MNDINDLVNAFVSGSSIVEKGTENITTTIKSEEIDSDLEIDDLDLELDE